MTTPSNDAIDIRVAPEAFDAWPALLAVLHEAFAAQQGRIAPPSSLWQLDAAGLAAKAAEETLFLATQSGALVGCLFAKSLGRSLHLGKFAVSPTHQRMGLGRRLVSAAEQHAAELGLGTLTLDTRIELTENHHAFAALGFAKDGEHAHAGFDRPTFISMRKLVPGRAAELVVQLRLAPHPEGGWFREVFRSAEVVKPADQRPSRSALTTIDFLLARGECSAWHRVGSDEVWHVLEGGPLRLWLMPPGLDTVHAVTLGVADDRGTAPRHVVPAGWWQAAEPLSGFAYVGATVGPGFDFADFELMRGDDKAGHALADRHPALVRLLQPSIRRR